MFPLMVIKIASKIPLTWILLKTPCLNLWGFIINVLKIKGLSSPPTAISYLKNGQVYQSGFPSAQLPVALAKLLPPN